MVRLIHILIFVFLSTAGCTHLDLDTAKFDPQTGRLASLDDIDEEEIKVNKPLRGIKNIPFVYLRTWSKDDSEDFELFVRDSLAQIGFTKFVSQPELTRLVVKAGLDDVKSVSDIFSLHRLTRAIGPYLLAEFVLVRETPQTWRFDIAMIDPVKAETVFSVSRTKTMLFDFDREITWPMMNALKQWYERSAQLPVRQAKEKRPRKEKMPRIGA